MNAQRLIKNLTKDVLPIAPDALAKRISIDAGGTVVIGLSRSGCNGLAICEVVCRLVIEQF
jgi:hypothetical protein